MAILEIVGRNKVRVSPTGVALFNVSWPCSRLDSGRAYWFEFDSRGELVDCDVPEHSDGPEAAALADDCRAYHFDDEQPAWLPMRG